MSKVIYCQTADERNNAIAELAPRYAVEYVFSRYNGRGSWMVAGADTKKNARLLAEAASVVRKYKNGIAGKIPMDKIVQSQELCNKIGIIDRRMNCTHLYNELCDKLGILV